MLKPSGLAWIFINARLFLVVLSPEIYVYTIFFFNAVTRVWPYCLESFRLLYYICCLPAWYILRILFSCKVVSLCFLGRAMVYLILYREINQGLRMQGRFPEVYLSPIEVVAMPKLTDVSNSTSGMQFHELFINRLKCWLNDRVETIEKWGSLKTCSECS